ncbi:hypothetical protein I3843_15G096000 [Carya illinoinensis]|nr:hypothetical protein I3843_15G096000 [Carya illinoinensis]
MSMTKVQVQYSLFKIITRYAVIMAITLGLSLDEPIKNRGSRERGKEKDLNYDILSSLCEGYTGSDLLELCKEAAYFTITVSALEHKFKFNEDEACRYFQQLINAIDYCHSRGIYQRNLKPENFLLDAYGNLKLSDFGSSALSQQVKDDGLNYVAPEILNDRGYDGTMVDVWSCGVILFVLIAGYLLFDDSNLMNLYKKVLAAKFNCPPWLSFNAMKLITRILDPNPITRITIPEILEDEWFKKDYMPCVQRKG